MTLQRARRRPRRERLLIATTTTVGAVYAALHVAYLLILAGGA